MPAEEHAPDSVIHPVTRLSICSALAAGAEWVDFATVRDSVGVSDAVLSKHSRILEDAGYLEVRKGAVGRRPRTWFRLTENGHAAYRRHVAWLQNLVQPSADQSNTDQSSTDHPARR